MKPWPSRKKAAIPFFVTPSMLSSPGAHLGWESARESLPYWAAAAEAAKALGGRLLLGEWFAALEAESLIEAVDPATGLRRAQEALALSQETESIIGEALAERAIGRAIAAGKRRSGRSSATYQKEPGNLREHRREIRNRARIAGSGRSTPRL